MRRPPKERGESLSSGSRIPRPPGAGRSTAPAHRLRFALRIAVIVAFLGSSVLLCAADSAQADARFRVGFSTTMFSDINENDAKASVKAWAQTIAASQGIPAHTETVVFGTLRALLQSLLAEQVDAVGIGMGEYDQIRGQVRLDPIFVTRFAGSLTDRFLLLAHRDGEVKCAADLLGRSVRFQNNIRSNLAPIWLDLLLAQQNLPATDRLGGKISLETKLIKVVLPVFFRQVDACVVTQSGFRMMCELNPEVGKRIEVLATSPELVPAIFAFRENYQPPFRQQLISGVTSLNTTVVGRQLLTVFQSDNIEQRPASFLDSTLEMLSTHARLNGKTNAVPGTPPAIPQNGRQETER